MKLLANCRVAFILIFCYSSLKYILLPTILSPPGIKSQYCHSLSILPVPRRAMANQSKHSLCVSWVDHEKSEDNSASSSNQHSTVYNNTKVLARLPKWVLLLVRSKSSCKSPNTVLPPSSAEAIRTMSSPSARVPFLTEMNRGILSAHLGVWNMKLHPLLPWE